MTEVMVNVQTLSEEIRSVLDLPLCISSALQKIEICSYIVFNVAIKLEQIFFINRLYI